MGFYWVSGNKGGKTNIVLANENHPFFQLNIFFFNLFVFYSTAFLTSDCCSFVVDWCV
jgi:hypothetical protein